MTKLNNLLSQIKEVSIINMGNLRVSLFDLLQFLSLCLIAYLLNSGISEHSLLTIFQDRDLYRVQRILNGEPIFYGSEIYGGGHLPGPFYYLLHIVPYLLCGLDGVICFNIVTFSVSCAFFFYLLKRFFDLPSACIGYLAYTLSQFNYLTVAFNLNPSLSPIFQVAMIYLLLSLKEKWDSKKFLIFSVILALSLQIHMSNLLLGFFSLFLFEKSKRRDFLMSLFIIFLSTIPFLLGKTYCHINEANFCPVNTSGSLSTGIEYFFIPFKRLLQSDKFSLLLEQGFSRLLFDFYIFDPIVLLLIFGFIFSFFLNRDWIELNKDKVSFLKKPLYISSVSVVWLLFGGDATFRYMAIFYYIFLIFLVYFGTNLIINLIKKSQKKELSFFICISLLVTGYFFPKDFNIVKRLVINENKRITMTYKEAKEIVHLAKERTDWSYEDFIERSYGIGVDLNIGFGAIYLDRYDVVTKKIVDRNFDGLLVVNKNIEDFKKFLPQATSKQQLNGDITITLIKELNRLKIFKYTIKKLSNGPRFFHNFLFNYYIPKSSLDIIRKVHKLKDKEILKEDGKYITCLDCDKLSWKYVEIGDEKIEEGRRLSVSIHSRSLSCTVDVCPYRVDYLKDIYLYYECENGYSEKFHIPFLAGDSFPVVYNHEDFFPKAPFHGEFLAKCPISLKTIKFGFKEGGYRTLQMSKTLNVGDVKYPGEEILILDPKI